MVAGSNSAIVSKCRSAVQGNIFGSAIIVCDGSGIAEAPVVDGYILIQFYAAATIGKYTAVHQNIFYPGNGASGFIVGSGDRCCGGSTLVA